MKMKNICTVFRTRNNSLEDYICSRFSCLSHSIRVISSSVFHVLIFSVNPFWIQLAYFMILSFFGCIALKITMPKTSEFMPKVLDLFFMSTSASTVSSMGTVEMEVFSNTQLLIMTLLMFLGGEVFVSLLGLQFMKLKFNQNQENKVGSVLSNSRNSLHQIELGRIDQQESDIPTPNYSLEWEYLKYNAIKILGFVVLTYLIVVHILGSCFIALCVYLDENSRKVLDTKRISLITFSIFTTTSTFSNCGFIPTNENMIVFKKNTGLLLVLIPQVLLGNTLYPLCLRIFIEFLERLTKRLEFGCMLNNFEELGYNNLFSRKKSGFLGVTVLGFILIMVVGLCLTEWNSNVMEGLNSYEKIVSALFLAVNSRHAGESVFDLSIVSPAMLVLYVFMMYLPPYTYFSPVDDTDDDAISTPKKKIQRKSKILEKFILSQISYLVIFTILICITERKKLMEDPLNFNVMNIIFEVTSAYGNVGFSTGYSCQRNLKANEYCKDENYGFVGRWSEKGKIILIVVMIFGRLKKFGLKGGRSWKLSS